MYELLPMLATYTYELDPDAIQRNFERLGGMSGAALGLGIVAGLLLVLLFCILQRQISKAERKLQRIDHAVTGLLRMQGQEPDNN